MKGLLGQTLHFLAKRESLSAETLNDWRSAGEVFASD